MAHQKRFQLHIYSVYTSIPVLRNSMAEHLYWIRYENIFVWFFKKDEIVILLIRIFLQ